VIVCEVQEYSDLTYRVYDFGRLDAQSRPRELHIEKALEVTHFGSTLAGKTVGLPLPVPSANAQRTLLAGCRYFATEKWKIASPVTIKMDPLHFDLIVVLAGRGLLRTPDFAAPCEQGECWFLPANLREFHFVPMESATFIRAYVPDLTSLRDELRHAGQNTAVNCTIFE
jgi:mannose-6-phosphate isomerase